MFAYNREDNMSIQDCIAKKLPLKLHTCKNVKGLIQNSDSVKVVNKT
jgi:hypothetical protein